jgi:GNAT superfamily N-acetyltransferase
MSKVEIKPATPEDTPDILKFIQLLAVYEKLEHECVATVEQLKRTLFGERKVAEVLFAVQDGRKIGFALFFHNYSTFLGKPGIYLEDLFVLPEARGVGAGKALLRHLAKLTVERDCGRLEWAVLDWNTPAIDFYKSVGAVAMDEWTVFRLTGDKLLSFAQG